MRPLIEGQGVRMVVFQSHRMLEKPGIPLAQNKDLLYVM